MKVRRNFAMILWSGGKEYGVCYFVLKEVYFFTGKAGRIEALVYPSVFSAHWRPAFSPCLQRCQAGRQFHDLFPAALLQKFYTEHSSGNRQKKWTGHFKINAHLLVESLFNSLLSYFDLREELPPDLAEVKIWETLTVLHTVAPQARHILHSFHEPGKIDLTNFMEQYFIYNLPLEKFSYLTGRRLSSFKKDFKTIFKTTPGRWLTAKWLELAHYQISVRKKTPVPRLPGRRFRRSFPLLFCF
ncbi:MAG TPA: hypothetical protein VGC22_13090 [Chitinophaga sp.]